MKKIYLWLIAFVVFMESISYAETENLIKIDFINERNMEIPIENKDVDISSEAENNAYLKSLQLNKEGIEPYFDKNIYEYYITVREDIENLEINAIPENNEAVVNITGNEKLNKGWNKINIEVISPNMKYYNIYTIYVTKTNQKEKANANLEILALENTLLSPEFSAMNTNYVAELPYEVETLKLLAVSEDKEADVLITGNENLKIGKNEIVITVTATNGYTQKKYYVNAYRADKDEENTKDMQDKEIKKIAVTFDNVNAENELDNLNNKNENNKNYRNFIIGISIIFIIAVFFLIKK